MSHQEISNVEIRSITEDEESDYDDSDSSYSDQYVSKCHEGPPDNVSNQEMVKNQVSSDEMIAAAIGSSPNISDICMDGCTNVTIGNQTHISGTVIIRNVLTKSFNDSDMKTIKDKDQLESSQRSISSTSDSFKEGNENSSWIFCGIKVNKKKLVLWMSIALLLIVLGVITGILLYILYQSDDPITTTTTTTLMPSTTSVTMTPPLSTTTISSSTSTTPSSTSTLSPTTTTSTSNTTPVPLRIIPRKEWQRVPNYATKPLKTPAKQIIISHTGAVLENEFPTGCDTNEQCTKFAVKLEDYYINKQSWSDLPYNFFMGKDGYVFEGRGWKLDGSFRSSFGDDCLSIGFLGNYNKFVLSPIQKELLFTLIDDGLSEIIDENHEIIGQCQIRENDNPGKYVYEEMRPHWANYSERWGILKECSFN
uniref:CSON011123 protein n=1 Tax=Culicoides sonorensis TaxID=179676 RepID=A0A336N4D1_CULSO